MTIVDFGRDLARSARHMADASPVPATVASGGDTVPATRLAPAKPRKRPVLAFVGGGNAALLVVSPAIYVPILRKDGSAATALPRAGQNPPDQIPKTVSPSAPIAVSLDVDKELTQAESQAKRDDQAEAREALKRLAALDGRIGAAGDAALDVVKERARGTSYQRKVDERLAVCP